MCRQMSVRSIGRPCTGRYGFRDFASFGLLSCSLIADWYRDRPNAWIQNELCYSIKPSHSWQFAKCRKLVSLRWNSCLKIVKVFALPNPLLSDFFGVFGELRRYQNLWGKQKLTGCPFEITWKSLRVESTDEHGQHKSIARANYSCINTLTVGKHHQTIHAGLALRDAQCTKWVTVDWGKICRFFRVFQVLASIVLSFSVNSPLLNDCAFFETTLVKIEKW